MGAAGAPVPALVANPVLLLGPVIGVALALAVGIALVAAARAVVALVAAAPATALGHPHVAALAVAPAPHLVVAVVAAVTLALALALVRVALAVSVASVSRIVAGERVVEETRAPFTCGEGALRSPRCRARAWRGAHLKVGDAALDEGLREVHRGELDEARPDAACALQSVVAPHAHAHFAIVLQDALEVTRSRALRHAFDDDARAGRGKRHDTVVRILCARRPDAFAEEQRRRCGQHS